MDKKVILAVAGSGKTTYVVNSLSENKRFLIITYTNRNHANLRKKIIKKFDGKWPESITLIKYFSFLYRFCYKPFLADKCKAKGLLFEPNPNKFVRQVSAEYFMTNSRYLYSNRLSLFLDANGIMDEVKRRLEKYFDVFIIDEVQDISGRDFTFLENIMLANLNMLFVGDFYQHTYDTSRDGNTNKNLFNQRVPYENRFRSKGFVIDNSTLINSWRCSQNVCDYVSKNLGISISSNRTATDNTTIEFITNSKLINTIFKDDNVIKLHYQNSAKIGLTHRNWGDTKGEDCYNDICVMLNKTTAGKRRANKLYELAPSTRNKLYVAITRARGNVYLIDE